MSRIRVKFFKALADDTRQEILRLLCERQELCVNDICSLIDSISQPTVSHHLQILRDSDILDSRKEGKLIFYKINRTVINDVGVSYFSEIVIKKEI